MIRLARSERAGRALLLLAVAIAFADSSIVVLAVPEVLTRFDVGIDTAAWVITAYNVAVVAAGLALLPLGRRISPRPLAAGGFGLFALASAACAAAPSFSVLVACRTVQGLAAGPVLVAAFPLLRGPHGARAWTLAATVGTAAGPALGGLLTEVFTWRAIFAAQAPLVALGLVAIALRAGPLEAGRGAGAAAGRRTLFANVALAALSAALVGALFLVVVLLIDGFGWEPLPAALAATTLPVVAVTAGALGRRLEPGLAGAVGSLLVAAGLATLGLLPGAAIELVLAGLVLCGAGLGLAGQALGERALVGRQPAEVAVRTVVARHLGLVAALLAVTPLLVASLTGFQANAEAVGGELVIRSPLPLSEKIPIMTDLARAADRAETGLPDFAATIGADTPGSSSAARELADHLTSSLEDLLARAFRSSFLACTLFGLVAAAASVPAGELRRRRPGRRVAAALAVILVLALAAPVADLARGALDDPTATADPCRAQTAFRGSGLDASIQRVALVALAGAACELHTSRPELLRALVSSDPAPWPDARLEDALRTGIDRAIAAERTRGTIGATTAGILSAVAERAPLLWIRQALQALG
jgi:MFS family permease